MVSLTPHSEFPIKIKCVIFEDHLSSMKNSLPRSSLFAELLAHFTYYKIFQGDKWRGYKLPF